MATTKKAAKKSTAVKKKAAKKSTAVKNKRPKRFVDITDQETPPMTFGKDLSEHAQ